MRSHKGNGLQEANNEENLDEAIQREHVSTLHVDGARQTDELVTGYQKQGSLSKMSQQYIPAIILKCMRHLLAAPSRRFQQQQQAPPLFLHFFCFPSSFLWL
jgi:hypothetical protein